MSELDSLATVDEADFLGILIIHQKTSLNAFCERFRGIEAVTFVFENHLPILT